MRLRSQVRLLILLLLVAFAPALRFGLPALVRGVTAETMERQARIFALELERSIRDISLAELADTAINPSA